MKKHSGNMSNIRPLFYDNLKADAKKVAEIKERFMYDQNFIHFYKSK